jgi:hypothetical protein
MIYEEIVEDLMKHFTSNEHQSEAVKARVEFHKVAGIFDEESEDFEMKLAQFTDWFLFTRNMISYDKTPIARVIDGEEYPIPSEKKTHYENFSNNRHSLFEFLKLKGDDVYIKDLFSGYKLVIRGSKVTFGFEKDQIFEARLLPHEDSFVFAKAFCFHPHEATKYINKEVKRVKKLPEEERDRGREELIEKLFRMRYKHEQYRHVDVKDIYSNESKLR